VPSASVHGPRQNLLELLMLGTGAGKAATTQATGVTAPAATAPPDAEAAAVARREAEAAAVAKRDAEAAAGVQRAAEGAKAFVTGTVETQHDLTERSLSGRATLQDELAAAFRSHFPDAIVKTINRDNVVYIHIPSVHPMRGSHLFFKTEQDQIQFGFYVRDPRFVAEVLASTTSVENRGRILRPLGNPIFDTGAAAVEAAQAFVRQLQVHRSGHPGVAAPVPPLASQVAEPLDAPVREAAAAAHRDAQAAAAAQQRDAEARQEFSSNWERTFGKQQAAAGALGEVQAQQPTPRSTTSNVATQAVIDSRAVSPLLGLGIVVAPYLFSWMTLRRGYSRKARLWSLGYLALVVLALGRDTSGSGDGDFQSDEPVAVAPDEPVVLATEPSLTPSPTPSDDVPEPELREQDNGFARSDLLQNVNGRLRLGMQDRLRMDLYAGYEYAVVARCDQNCADLDLYMEDESGANIAADNAVDAAPELAWRTARNSGAVLNVYMADCSEPMCAYKVRVYRRPLSSSAVVAGDDPLAVSATETEPPSPPSGRYRVEEARPAAPAGVPEVAGTDPVTFDQVVTRAVLLLLDDAAYGDAWEVLRNNERRVSAGALRDLRERVRQACAADNADLARRGQPTVVCPR
jgi:hypothetical protein